MLEKGLNKIEEEDLASEEEEEVSSNDSKKQKKKGEDKKEKEKQTIAPQITPLQNNDLLKQLIVGEGSGKDFLKNEIEKLIKNIQDRQSVGDGIHTFIRLEPPKKGWEENYSNQAGLFQNKGAELPKLDDEDEENEEEDEGKNEKDLIQD